MSDSSWKTVCDAVDVAPMIGVRALVNNEQVAIFRVNGQLHGLSAIDPFSNAAILSRGIVGDLKGHIVVASPLYKQHFILESGACLEDETVSIKTYPIREYEDKIQVKVA